MNKGEIVMSKNFRRSAVALVLAATMVFGSQGFTAFADNGDNSGMPELLSVQTTIQACLNYHHYQQKR